MYYLKLHEMNEVFFLSEKMYYLLWETWERDKLNWGVFYLLKKEKKGIICIYIHPELFCLSNFLFIKFLFIKTYSLSLPFFDVINNGTHVN